MLLGWLWDHVEKHSRLQSSTTHLYGRRADAEERCPEGMDRN